MVREDLEGRAEAGSGEAWCPRARNSTQTLGGLCGWSADQTGWEEFGLCFSCYFVLFGCLVGLLVFGCTGVHYTGETNLELVLLFPPTLQVLGLQSRPIGFHFPVFIQCWILKPKLHGCPASALPLNYIPACSTDSNKKPRDRHWDSG